MIDETPGLPDHAKMTRLPSGISPDNKEEGKTEELIGKVDGLKKSSSELP